MAYLTSVVIWIGQAPTCMKEKLNNILCKRWIKWTQILNIHNKGGMGGRNRDNEVLCSTTKSWMMAILPRGRKNKLSPARDLLNGKKTCYEWPSRACDHLQSSSCYISYTSQFATTQYDLFHLKIWINKQYKLNGSIHHPHHRIYMYII